MGVDVAGDAMGGPTGVGDAAVPVDRSLLQLVGQFLDAPLGFYRPDDTILKDGEAGGILSPVLQVSQSFEQYFFGLPEAAVSNDTTHNRILLVIYF